MTGDEVTEALGYITEKQARDFTDEELLKRLKGSCHFNNTTLVNEIVYRLFSKAMDEVKRE